MLKNGNQANQSSTDIPQISSSITLLKPGIGKPPFPLLWPILLPSKPTFTSDFTDKWSSSVGHTLDLPPVGIPQDHGVPGPAPCTAGGADRQTDRHPWCPPFWPEMQPLLRNPTVAWEHHAQGRNKKALLIIAYQHRTPQKKNSFHCHGNRFCTHSGTTLGG